MEGGGGAQSSIGKAGTGQADGPDRPHRAISGLALKLTRTFATQIEALAKLRNGGKQQVEVRHVYVNGNAVIGDVHAGTGGGGSLENGRRPHAPGLAFAPGEAVRGDIQAEREAVPVAGGEGEADV